MSTETTTVVGFSAASVGCDAFKHCKPQALWSSIYRDSLIEPRAIDSASRQTEDLVGIDMPVHLRCTPFAVSAAVCRRGIFLTPGMAGCWPGNGSTFRDSSTVVERSVTLGIGATIGQILLLDLVFLINTTITAASMTLSAVVTVLGAHHLANFINAPSNGDDAGTRLSADGRCDFNG